VKVDMSAKAVTTRLQLVSQLRRLCLELGKAKPVASSKTSDATSGDVEPQSTTEPGECQEPPTP
jgi:hypothetical protein